MFRSRKPATRVFPPAFRRRLRLEWLEDRATPATFFVDNDLVPGASITTLNNSNLGFTVTDENANGTLDAGDRVTVTLPGQGSTNFTFQTDPAQGPANGDAGVAFGTIASALTAANTAAGTDNIFVGKGTYSESLNVNSPVNLAGVTGVASDVTVTPAAGSAGVTVSAAGVTLSDLTVSGVTGAAGITGTGLTSLTLNDVTVSGGNQAGLNLTGTGASGTSLTLNGVTVSGNAGQALNVSGFATVNVTGGSVTAGGGATQSTITFPVALTNATLNVSEAGSSTPAAITVTGTSVQVGSGESVSLANADNVNVTGGSGADTFVVTAPPTGGAHITISGGLPVPASGTGTAGDTLDLTSTSGLTVTATPSNNGFTGTITSGSTATVNFSGIEKFADGATISGRVTDQNGAGVANVTVQLDVGANGTVDLTTTTDASGNYSFTGLPPGDYRVRIVVPAGDQLLSSNPGDFNNVTLGQTISNVNFQLHTGATLTGGTVTGVVYADVNNNNVRDAGENGVRGVTVYLDLNNNGKLDKSEPRAVTDTTGAYTLTTTQNGTFQVRAVLSPGYLRSSGFLSVTLTGGGTATADIGLFTNLPPQSTPARRLAAGYIIGGRAHVRLFDADGSELGDREVFSGLSMPDVRVAVADVTGDGVEDVIVGTGPGVPTQVIVLDGTNLQEIARLTPFESTFTGGVFVAAGDINGDGVADIIVSPDQSGGPRVLVFQGGPVGQPGTFQQIASFFGIDDANFRGGARVAVADINHDGVPDVIVAAGFGGGPRVAVFDGTSILSGSLTRLFNDFFIFEQTLRNGAFITAGDVDGDGFADLIGGGGPGGGPRVLALSGADLMHGKGGNSQALANFFAGDPNSRGGVRLTAKDTDGDGKVEIITGSGEGTHGKAHRFRGNGQDDGFDFDAGDDNGVFVG